MQRVEIVWEDIATKVGWLDAPESYMPEICHTIGYLLTRDAQYLRVVSGYSEEGKCDVTVFPVGVIKEVREL